MALASYNLASINIGTITNQTKLNALRTFISSQSLDIVCLQEVENEQLSLPGFIVFANVDHTRRGTAVAVKDHIHVSHVEKSLDSRLIALRLHDTTICNVYAPSGTAQRAAREDFFNGTLAYYLRHRTANVIIAGDFNCVLRACDSSSPNTSPSLKTAVQQLQLHDVWEKLCPRDPGFTYINRNAQSRLDRMYVSAGLRNNLQSAYTHVCCFTDHKALTVRLCLPPLGHEPGRGFWALRPHLLTEENVAEFHYKWQYWTRQRRNYGSWMEWWLSYAKPKIKTFFKWKSRSIFEDFHDAHQRLYAQLRLAYDGWGKTTEKTTITQLQTADNEVADEPHEIEANLFAFFSSLYTEEAADNNEDGFVCERIIPPDDPLNEACTEEITTAEILAAIRASAPKRFSGADGIPREFYLRMFNVIHRELNLLLNEALTGNLPHTFEEGIIVLVKKGGENTARAYRPISLLNSDYKLLSRIIKTRLERVMQAHRILSAGQKCSNAERNIFQATLALKDRIASLRHHRRPGKLISFDLENAFDRVRHSFLFDTMRSLGFNEELIALLARIASRSTSRLLVNGHLSRSFDISRSVRQGDPLSMHLFVLYLHPLVSRLEQVCGEDLLVAYTDDISVIVTSPWHFEAMREVFCRFGLVAAA
ncbi:uncharacterized protein LOC134222706 [Armigeres subalbatus]|uniref:uncharacterized protein LOC134222706 n=1 Tax=Armigeres subalbatus TaxID=124917 RepID=UPI002ED2FACA